MSGIFFSSLHLKKKFFFFPHTPLANDILSSPARLSQDLHLSITAHPCSFSQSNTPLSACVKPSNAEEYLKEKRGPMSHKKSQESLKNFISNIIGLKYLDPVPGKENSGGGDNEKTRENSFFPKRTKMSHFR